MISLIKCAFVLPLDVSYLATNSFYGQVRVIFKEIYYRFTKYFIEHIISSSKSYTILFKNMFGGLVYFSSYLVPKCSKYGCVWQSPAQILSPQPYHPVALTRLICASVISSQNLATLSGVYFKENGIYGAGILKLLA